MTAHALDEYIKEHGAHGILEGGTYLALWNPEERTSLNQGYKVDTHAPGLLLFGSNGGGEGFGFDTRKPHWPIVMVPFIGMPWNDALSVGETFAEFIENARACRLFPK